MQLFHEYLQEHVVQRQVKQADHQVTEELDPPLHIGITEHHVFRHKKPHRECNGERKHQRRDMSLERVNPKMKGLFRENVFETDKIDEQPEQGIPAPRCRIAEGLYIHQLPERRVKKINNGKDKIPGTMDMTAHQRAK